MSGEKLESNIMKQLERDTLLYYTIKRAFYISLCTFGLYIIAATIYCMFIGVVNG